MKPYFEKIFNIAFADDYDSNDEFSVNLKHYPQYLYKYRTCDKDYNFEMIEEEYLWADSPNTFYDPHDSLINLRLLSEMPQIKNWFWNHFGELIYYYIPPKGMQSHKNGQTLQTYIDAQSKFCDSKGRYSAQKAKKIMTIETKKLKPKHRQEIQKIYDYFESPAFEEKTGPIIQKALSDFVNSLREEMLVCCLTARKDNKKMWEEYAGKYEGFVIEYDTKKAVDNKDLFELISCIFPVAYYKRMPKVPLLPFFQYQFYFELYGREINVFDSVKKLYKQLLCKNYDYRAEEEWRLIADKNKVSFPLISAVYAGYKISDENLNKLKKYCSDKGIPLYKQAINTFNGKIIFETVD